MLSGMTVGDGVDYVRVVFRLPDFAYPDESETDRPAR